MSKSKPKKHHFILDVILSLLTGGVWFIYIVIDILEQTASNYSNASLFIL